MLKLLSTSVPSCDGCLVEGSESDWNRVELLRGEWVVRQVRLPARLVSSRETLGHSVRRFRGPETDGCVVHGPENKRGTLDSDSIDRRQCALAGKWRHRAAPETRRCVLVDWWAGVKNAPR